MLGRRGKGVVVLLARGRRDEATDLPAGPRISAGRGCARRGRGRRGRVGLGQRRACLQGAQPVAGALGGRAPGFKGRVGWFGEAGAPLAACPGRRRCVAW